MSFSLPFKRVNLIPNFNFKKKKKNMSVKSFLNMYREPTSTYRIIPNNSPEPTGGRGGGFGGRGGFGGGRSRFGGNGGGGDLEPIYASSYEAENLLNVCTSMFSQFYPPERIRLRKDGIKVKLNDLISYKIVFVNGQIQFHLTIPEKWSKTFLNAVKRDWGQVDITKVDEGFIDFKPNKAKAVEFQLRHHYALAIQHGKGENHFYPSIASLGSTLKDTDKLVIDFNIRPQDEKWKKQSKEKLDAFKNGRVPSKGERYSVLGLIGSFFDFIDLLMDEALKMMDGLFGIEEEEQSKEQLFDLNYSTEKSYENSRGYDVQIRAIAESEDTKRSKHILKSVETAFNTLDGDNRFVIKYIKTQRGIKSIIEAVKNDKPLPLRDKQIFFEKEMNSLVSIPNKTTLKEYKSIIEQDNFTRTEIDNSFLDDSNDAIPFAQTIDKDSKVLHFGGYKRDDWSSKGRYVKDKTRLDDRSTATMAFGSMGSGKTSLSIRQALMTFGAHIEDDEEWRKRSKSCVVFDVADGDMINKIWNAIPEKRRDRVVVLNHSNFNNPIAVNNADLDEFNREVMKDDDYAFTLAEMESQLVSDILETDKSIYVDRWFVTALQVAHSIHPDWGYPEAMRILVDDDFRINEVIPKLKDKRLKIELDTFTEMKDGKQADQIIQVIQNRFVQLERDQKLWDCIAQKPMRDENGKVKLNFRKMMDGDEDGAYLILVYIPKSGVSKVFRRFLFAHYFTKVWNVALSREVGFGGREFRPETLVIIDEIHQIIDIPLVAKLFIDLFKEPRKYSIRYLLTLHGWSSLSKAGRGLENDIKQSILDNGCNLIMLKGGRDAFTSLENFLQPMTTEDYDNLMNLDFCGIFGIRYRNKNHVFQARLLPPVEDQLPKYDDWDADMLTKYASPYGRDKEEVREENLERIEAMLKKSLKAGDVGGGNSSANRSGGSRPTGGSARPGQNGGGGSSWRDRLRNERNGINGAQ